MCCAALLAFGLGPRIALVFIWIFGDRIDRAFDSWIWPLLGPAALAVDDADVRARLGPGGVNGGEWILVALGVVLDIASYSARAAKGRTSYY